MTITLNGEPILPPVHCDGCGAAAKAESVNTHLCDGGLVIDPHDIGYYGGYLDPFPDDNLPTWKLCSRCADKFFDTFPALLEMLQQAND